MTKTSNLMAMGALLALGLPTSATAAILLAAFRQYGLQPGPLLFDRAPDLVWALLASFFVGMVVLLILNLPFAPLWAKLARTLFENGEGLYGFAGLRAFKAKYSPDWTPRYIATPRGPGMIRALIGLTRVVGR